MVEENAKKALIDIVRYAYMGSPDLKYYCDFEYVIVPKELKTKHGDYNLTSHRIRIFNTKSRTLTHLIITSIHELAHHTDYVNRSTTDHSKAFYQEYRRLLFAALDMRMFSIKEALEISRDAADAVKVKLMLIEYMEEGRAKRDIIKRCKKIRVYGAYDIKDSLKAMGFTWNGSGKTWDKELGDDAEKDVMKVESLIRECGKDIRYELEEPVSFDTPPKLPDKWSFHEFTKEEREDLLSGKEIWIEKCWSSKKAVFFSCFLAWNGEELIARYGD